MKNWRQRRNFRKYQNTDGTFTYIINVFGENIEVSEEIYSEYASLDRKMEYMERDLKRNRTLKDASGRRVRDNNGLPIELPEREISLDKLIEDGWFFPSLMPSPEEVFFSMEGSDEAELRRCVTLLSEEEGKLIKSLFFNNLGSVEK